MTLPWSCVRKCQLLLALVCLLSSVVRGQARPQVVEKIDNTNRVALTGNVHPLARAEFDRGAVSDSQRMNRILLLLKRSPEQQTALQTYMEAQQDKSSPNYHQWLTPDQFGALYGPADADVEAVQQWLVSQGFQIEKVYSGKTVIISGKVTKFSENILGKNWIHIDDGTDYSGKADITATIDQVVKVGDNVTVEGTITTGKDFGSGYYFDVIMENAKVQIKH